MSASNQWHVGLVGYGEVGRILAEDLREQDVKVSAYDIKLGGDAGRAVAGPCRAHRRARWRRRMPIWRRRADLIVSAVTASQAVPVAEACAPAVQAGRLVSRFQLGLAGRQAARRRR